MKGVRKRRRRRLLLCEEGDEEKERNEKSKKGSIKNAVHIMFVMWFFSLKKTSCLSLLSPSSSISLSVKLRRKSEESVRVTRKRDVC